MAQAVAQAQRRAERDAMLTHLATLDDYVTGRATVEAGRTATDALLALLGAKRR